MVRVGRCGGGDARLYSVGLPKARRWKRKEACTRKKNRIHSALCMRAPFFFSCKKSVPWRSPADSTKRRRGPVHDAHRVLAQILERWRFYSRTRCARFIFACTSKNEIRTRVDLQVLGVLANCPLFFYRKRLKRSRRASALALFQARNAARPCTFLIFFHAFFIASPKRLDRRRSVEKTPSAGVESVGRGQNTTDRRPRRNTLTPSREEKKKVENTWPHWTKPRPTPTLLRQSRGACGVPSRRDTGDFRDSFFFSSREQKEARTRRPLSRAFFFFLQSIRRTSRALCVFQHFTPFFFFR